MGVLSYQNSLKGYAIKNRSSRIIFENRSALISCAAPVALAEQIKVCTESRGEYGRREQTRRMRAGDAIR
ncbi:MAG: hypothetical protein KA779_11325 [Propionivibrio sp.]|jgi:hypothetical protein|nr:hypothetical protein [Propionivibrio sp.]MBP6711566.1 hypothetical protein [Propionivibrio sp.]MBP7525347.1 hypothetical protein [Propionivibrio sp.]